MKGLSAVLSALRTVSCTSTFSAARTFGTQSHWPAMSTGGWLRCMKQPCLLHLFLVPQQLSCIPSPPA